MSGDYKTVCDTCFQGTWYETEQPCKRTVPIFCTSCRQPTGKYRPCKGALRVIDRNELDPRFTRFYINQERVEVTYEWGEKDRFYVGKSTGWKPIYLALPKRNSSGGTGILSSAIKEIHPLGKYR